MEQQILGEITSQIRMARGALPSSLNMLKDLVVKLEEALGYQETAAQNPAEGNEEGEEAKRAYKKWEARAA